MKRALAALVLSAGILPALGSAQTVRTTFGLGNVREPTAACGTDGCQILIYDSAPTGNPPVNCPPGTAYTEAGCARRGPDEMISSGILIQSSQAYSYYPIPGTFTIEENMATHVVTMVSNPDGSHSGHVNNVFLDIDLGFDSFLIPSALDFNYDGAIGDHINNAQGDRIVWRNNLPPPNGPGVPYGIQGCLTCQSSSGSGCGLLGLAPPPPLLEGDPVCDVQVQPGDPHRRVMPDWVSKDGFATWRFPDNGDGTFAGGTESIVADAADIGGINNGGGWVFFGFRGRECGTKGFSAGDPFHPNVGKPDSNCDGNADWTYGLGGIDEPACYDTLRWCTGTRTECNFDADCPAPKTCDALPDGVCQGTSTQCFIASECGPKICSNHPTQTCTSSLECGPGVCQGTTTVCTSNAQCGASIPCVPTFGAICVPSVNCVPLADKLCTGTVTGCTTNANCVAPATCRATSTPIPAFGGDFVCQPLVVCPGAHTPGTACPTGCYENPSLTTQCNKLDRSLIMRTSSLSLMRDPDHDYFPLRGTIEIVEDPDAAQTKWCSGGSPIAGTPKLTPKKFCTSAAECPAGETCDPATTVKWCSGTSTPCTTNANCFSPSLCSTVGTVYVPPGSKSAWNKNSTIIEFVPSLGQTFTTISASQTGLERATGRGSPNDVIVWNGPTQPYTVPSGSCYYCSATAVGACALIGRADRAITCNTGQIGDPGVREWPDWISFDQGQSFQLRNSNGRLGDPNPAHFDPIIESYQDSSLNLASTTANDYPVVLFGYLRRECATTNNPSGSNPAGNPANARSGMPDQDCDRKVDPGIFPLASDPGDPGFPAPVPLPPDLVQDVCITYAQTADTDTNGDKHGDQCSCGDQNRNFAVNVSDLVAINTAIFNPAVATLFCDANNDSRCNVSDIVDTNLEIFSPGTTANCVYNLVDSNP